DAAGRSSVHSRRSSDLHGAGFHAGRRAGIQRRGNRRDAARRRAVRGIRAGGRSAAGARGRGGKRRRRQQRGRADGETDIRRVAVAAGDRGAMNMNRNPSSPIAQLLRGLHLDLPLLAGLLALMGISMVVLWSAGGESSALLFRQGLRLAIALAGMLFIAQVSPHYLRMWTPWVNLASVVLLLLVLVTGDIGKGAQRWLDLDSVRFQPAELMKLAVPMIVAWYLNDRPLPPRFADLLVAGLIVAIPAALIIEQPDLGTSLLVISGGAFAIFLAGLRWRWILGLFAMFAVAAPLAWHFMLHNYQKQRVLTFLNPE